MSAGRPPTLWWVLILSAPCVSLRRRALDHVRVERALRQEVERPRARPRRASKTRTKVSPIDLALLLRVGHAGQLAPGSARWRRRRPACMPKLRPKTSRTVSGSPSRSRPLLTKTGVSWSPIARWISAAATEESTPPERPQQHPAVLADLRADVADRLLDERRRRSSRRLAAADVVEEVAQDQRLAARRVGDLRVELDRVELIGRAGHRRAGGVGAVRDRRRSRAAASRSGRRGSSRHRVRAAIRRRAVVPASAVTVIWPGRTRGASADATRPPSACASSCMP